MSQDKVIVAGTGMGPFTKPGANAPYEVMGEAAISEALRDAGISYDAVEQAYASYVYGDSCCGQVAVYRAGLTGIPVFNVNNNCSSGSTALFLARQAVQSGAVQCALAVGFEAMKRGALDSHFDDRVSPVDSLITTLGALVDAPPGPPALRLFGSAGTAYIDKYGANPDIFYKVAVKTRRHAEHNDKAIFRAPLTLDEVASSPVVYAPYLTRYCACPPSCGAAAAIVVSEAFAAANGITDGVEIVGQALTTDTAETERDPITLVGSDMTRRAAELVFEQAGLGPSDVDVVELHDCFTPNEVISYEGLGLCPEGGAEKLINDGDNSYGGQWVVNPSGGLMSKGHPLGATGLAQCHELASQLRGRCGKRQVDSAKVALQHNIGLGGACVVTMYARP